MNGQIKMEFAFRYSRLRELGFTEEEINEFKAVKHTIQHLDTMIEIYSLVERELATANEELLGIRRNSD